MMMISSWTPYIAKLCEVVELSGSRKGFLLIERLLRALMRAFDRSSVGPLLRSSVELFSLHKLSFKHELYWSLFFSVKTHCSNVCFHCVGTGWAGIFVHTPLSLDSCGSRLFGSKPSENIRPGMIGALDCFQPTQILNRSINIHGQSSALFNSTLVVNFWVDHVTLLLTFYYLYTGNCIL